MPRRTSPALLALLPAMLLLPAALPAAAQEGPIELADDPFEITDPKASAPGEAELAVIGSYERARRGRVRNTAGAESELGIGVAPRLEIRLGEIGAYGNLNVRRNLDFRTDTTGAGERREPAAFGGATRLGALYQLTDEQGALPAIGLLGRVRLVYGPGRPAYETEAIALVGKTILHGERPLAVHLNLGWVTRLETLPGERPSRYLFNASIGLAVLRDTALVAAYLREQQERGERDFSLAQVGIRQRMPDGRTVLGLVAGVGGNRDSPRFQIAFAVQWAFGSGGR